MIDSSFAEVFPCRYNPDDCDFKLKWVEAGSPFGIPFDVAVGKCYIPLVSDWIKSKYSNSKGIKV